MSFFSGQFFAGEFFDSGPVQQVVVLSGAAEPWQDYVTERNRRKLKLQLRTHERQLKKVEKKIDNAYKRVVAVKNTDGILANLHRLETKRSEIVAHIQELKIEFSPLDFDDEDEIEALLLDS